jgi:hypothetical protein
MERTDISDGTWTFYDSWVAFPHNRDLAKSNQTGEFMVSLDAPGGGTYGEFAIVWYELGGQPFPRIEAFNDAWKALASRPDLLRAFGAMSERTTQATIAGVLASLGFVDKTDELREKVPGLKVCPTCGGSGKVAE